MILKTCRVQLFDIRIEVVIRKGEPSVNSGYHQRQNTFRRRFYNGSYLCKKPLIVAYLRSQDIELPGDADPWEVPLILSSFVKKGEYTVNAFWSKLWVQQRIIPPDRQNIGQILKENGLENYDEYELLMLGEGKCAQDNYYLHPLSEGALSIKFPTRYERKIEDVVPLENSQLLVFFRDGNLFMKSEVEQRMWK